MNNKAIEICHRNELWALIKKVSAFYGEDDKDFLKSFAKEMIENNTLTSCLECFRDLARHCQEKPAKQKAMQETKKITYQPPFD